MCRSMDEEKKTIGEKVDEILKWSNDHPAAGKDEFDAKVKELEAIFNPIMTKIYQQTGGAPGGMPTNLEQDHNQEQVLNHLQELHKGELTMLNKLYKSNYY